MRNFYLFIVLWCGMSFVGGDDANAENSISAKDSTANEIVDGDVSVYSIRLSKQRPFKSDFAVDKNDRKIYVFAGRRIVERTHIKQLFEKYFDGSTPNLFHLHGNGVAWYNASGNGTAQLEIYAEEPGPFSIEYSNRFHGKDDIRNWTVYSIPSHTLERGSPFEFKVDFFRVDVMEGKPEIKDLEHIKVDIHSKPGTLIIRGTGEDIQNGTLLDIMIEKPRSPPNRHRIRLLVEEPVPPKETRTPKESIQLWIENFHDTEWTRQGFLKCVAAAYGVKASDLHVKTFTYLRNRIMFFEAQLFETDTCSRQESILGRVLACGSSTIGHRLTCLIGETLEGSRRAATSTDHPATQHSLPTVAESQNEIDTGGHGASSKSVSSRPDPSPNTPSRASPSRTTATTASTSTAPTPVGDSSISSMPKSTEAPVPNSTLTPLLKTNVFTTPESLGNTETTGRYRTDRSQLGSYSSFLNHIKFYGIVWLGIFIVMFLLIVVLSQ